MGITIWPPHTQGLVWVLQARRIIHYCFMASTITRTNQDHQMNSTVSTGGWFSFSQMRLHPSCLVTSWCDCHVTLAPSSHQLHEFVVLHVSQLCHHSRELQRRPWPACFLLQWQKSVPKSQAVRLYYIMGSIKYRTLYLNNKVWHSNRVQQINSWRGSEAVVRQID